MSGFLRELLNPDFGKKIAAFKKDSSATPYAIQKAGAELLKPAPMPIWEPPVERPRCPTLFERFTLSGQARVSA